MWSTLRSVAGLSASAGVLTPGVEDVRSACATMPARATSGNLATMRMISSNPGLAPRSGVGREEPASGKGDGAGGFRRKPILSQTRRFGSDLDDTSLKSLGSIDRFLFMSITWLALVWLPILMPKTAGFGRV